MKEFLQTSLAGSGDGHDLLVQNCFNQVAWQSHAKSIKSTVTRIYVVDLNVAFPGIRRLLFLELFFPSCVALCFVSAKDWAVFCHIPLSFECFGAHSPSASAREVLSMFTTSWCRQY